MSISASSSAIPVPDPVDIDAIDRDRLTPAPDVSAGAAPAALAENKGLAARVRINDILSRANETTDAIAARLIKIKAAENPLMTAAQPLVLTLASLSSLVLSADTVPAFHALLVREVETFQRLCTQANLPREHVVAASYALCTALDEAANGTEWGGGNAAAGIANSAVGVWASQMLASYFHDDTAGGIKVYQLIGRLMTHKPEGHIDLLELLHCILSLGFEGQYRSLPDGRRQHETIRQRIHAVISQARPPVPLALSPQWQGVGAGKFKLLRSVPVWVTASVLALALFGLFSWYKYRLIQQTNVLVAEIVAIGKMTPPPVVVAPLRLAELLRVEIAQGKVTVVEDERHSQIVLQGDDMFIPGHASLSPKIKPLLDKVATGIARVTGTVQVVGHSDSQPIRTSRFPNNQVLSEERASVVADALQAAGVAAGRIEIRGQGDVTPVADNATAAGRAKNRRVEIDVMAALIPAAVSAYAMADSAP